MGGVLIAFIFGLIWGSFLNVVILRFDDWLSILKDRSHCPKCKAKLPWYDLVPLFSFIALRGKCRTCQQPISWQYPIVELSTAALVAAGYYLIFLLNDLSLLNASLALVSYILVTGALIAIFFHDLYEMLVPEVLSYIALIAAAFFSLFFFQDWQTTLYGGLAAVVPIALLVYPSKGVWMGEGDVKIAAALGLLVGWPAVLVFLIGAFVIGGVYGAVLMLGGRAKMKSAVPFAPFLIIAGFLALFWGSHMVSWYMGILGYAY
jgi:prepilin signal peptidase PulO-like enzyme (type II secretory pathway)